MDIGKGMRWVLVYWVHASRKDIPAHWKHVPEVREPPVSGFQHAVVLAGDRRSTIFCPYSMEAFQVSNGSAELMNAQEPRDPFNREWLVDLIGRNWEACQRRGWQRAYDTAALVLSRLGAPIPQQVTRDGEEDNRQKGGKEVADKLLKLVRRSTKRGIFLQWFMEGQNARGVREAMTHFGMSRSNVLTYLFMLQKDHGIGYSLTGDTATITFPKGCEQPFEDGDPLA